MTNQTICSHCGESYYQIAQHWNGYPSHRPEFTEYQREVITGLMMSDGTLETLPTGSRFTLTMITNEYIKWFNNLLSELTTGVNLTITANDLAGRNRKREFSTTVNEENYHDVWRVRTRVHPELDEFDWYTGENNKKVWPSEIELTPTVLTHFYIGDGTRTNRESHDNIRIAMHNERENKNKIKSYFKSKKLPVPTFQVGNNNTYMRFLKDESLELWEYMDPAPPGFEYKFPEQFHNKEFY